MTVIFTLALKPSIWCKEYYFQPDMVYYYSKFKNLDGKLKVITMNRDKSL